jgi:hypothetical protein
MPMKQTFTDKKGEQLILFSNSFLFYQLTFNLTKTLESHEENL